MPNKKTFDPFDSLRKYSTQLEKNMNDLIHLWTNNREFVRLSRMSSNTHLGYIEYLRKNQEYLASHLNQPTKSDLANVAKIAIQTEEKLDLLEEQIWSISDSVIKTNKEIESIVDVSKDVIKMTKQLKNELTKAQKEMTKTKELKNELQELKEELIGFKELFMAMNVPEIGQQEEFELVGASETK